MDDFGSMATSVQVITLIRPFQLPGFSKYPLRSDSEIADVTSDLGTFL